MSKELELATAICVANNVATDNLGEAQIISIANALSVAATTSQMEQLSEQLTKSKKALADKVADIKLTPTQRAVKQARENAKDGISALQEQLDALRQAQAAETGAKIGTKISDATSKVDEVISDRVPGVSHVKGFFRGLTGALRS